jgi:hypothetical protein
MNSVAACALFYWATARFNYKIWLFWIMASKPMPSGTSVVNPSLN